MLNSEFKIGVDHRIPLLGVIWWNMLSRVMPALLTRTSTGPRSCFDFLQAGRAGLVS